MEFVDLWPKAMVCINAPKVVAHVSFAERPKQGWNEPSLKAAAQFLWYSRTWDFFRNGGGWSSEENEVQRWLKLSVMFLVKHNLLWLIPKAASHLLQRQPEGKHVTSIFHPLGMSSGVLPKVGPQRRMERGGGREQLTTPLPFPPAKPGCVSSPHFFQPLVGAEGNLHHQPGWQSRGSPSVPGCRGAGEGAGSQAVLRGTWGRNIYIGHAGS